MIPLPKPPYRCRSSTGPLLVAISLALAAPACTSGEAPAAQPGGRNSRSRVVPVTVTVAEYGSAARAVSASGIVEPLRTVGVNSQLAGAIAEIAVQEGDQVREGQLLARILAPEVEAQLVSAEAALEVAESQARRSDALFEQQVITAAEHERDRAALIAARAARDQLRTRLGYTAVRAPVDGVILEKRVEAGDLASTQSRLFTVGDVSTLVVRVPVSELDVTALREGTPVTVSLDALPGSDVHGSIRRIFPAADSVTRLVPVEVAIGGPAARNVRPGFLARVSFALSPRSGVLLLPGAALLQNPRGAAVYVIQDGRATLRSVQRGGTYDGRVEITSGLAPGDSVVVAGNTMLREGSEVTIATAPGDTIPASDRAGQTVGVAP